MILAINSKFKKTFTCLAIIILLNPSLPVIPTTASIANKDFLKYEVSDVFVGSVKHTVLIYNPTFNILADGKLFVPLMRNETARHYTILYNVSSTFGQPAFINDSSGNTYAYWDSITINGRRNFTAEINYYVLSYSTRYPINSSLVTSYDKDSSLYKRYTQPESLIQSDDAKIIAKAQNITASTNDTLGKTSKIYEFVTTYLHYAVQDGERGTLWALENKTGDCSEYSYLFVALCRAVGIPSRVQAGFAFRSAGETTEDGHMWVEYYLEGYGWVPADPTWKLLNSVDCRHFGSLQSIPEVTPYANFLFNSTRGFELEDKQTVTLNSCSFSVFGNDSFAETVTKASQKIRQTNVALLVGKIFGASWIFPSEMRMAEQSLLESSMHLQHAIEQVDRAEANSSLEEADESARIVWMAIFRVIAVIIIVLLVVAVLAFVFPWRRKNIEKGKKNDAVSSCTNPENAGMIRLCERKGSCFLRDSVPRLYVCSKNHIELC